jgi:predicted PurR-regulated permease PerM
VIDKQEVKEIAETAAAAASTASWLQTRVILRLVFIIITAIIVILASLWVLRALTSVIMLVILAIFFAYLIAPLVEFVCRPFNVRGRERIMPRPLAIGVVYLLLFGSLTIALSFLLPRLGDQISQFAVKAPDYFTSARGRAQKLNELYSKYNLPEGVRKAINENVTKIITTAGEYTTEGVGTFLLGSLHFIPWLILIPILAFFLLKDADSFRRSALKMLPRGRWRWRGDEFFQDVNSTLAAYIRAQLIACLLIGTICTVGFAIIGVPYALLLGIIAGLFEFIPLVGPLVVAVIAILITGFYSINKAIVVFLFLGVLRIVHDYVTYPRIIGQGIHLHPLAVILAILSGAELAGVAGIFLAIPVVAITTVTYRHWLEHRGSEGLVADLLKPAEQAALAPASADAPQSGNGSPEAPAPDDDYPNIDTTPEEMARLRPDLTTGELKLPKVIEERQK